MLKSEMRNRNQIWQESDSVPGNGIFFLVIVYYVHVQYSIIKKHEIVDFDWVNFFQIMLWYDSFSDWKHKVYDIRYID